MQSERQSPVGQLVPCCQRDEHTRLSKRTAKTGTKKIVTRKTVRVLGQNTRPHHSRKEEHERSLSIQLVGDIDRIHGQRKVRNMLRPLAPLGETSMLSSVGHFVKQHVDPLYVRAIHGHSGAQIRPNFLVAENLRKRLCEKAPPRRACEVRQP